MCGVAHLGDYFYVLTQDEAPKVSVYGLDDFHLNATIELPIMISPSDIAACQKKQRLYVADSRYILCAYPGGDYEIWLEAEFAAPDFGVSSVSVTSGRLLVTSYTGQQLILYSEELERIALIGLPYYMRPLYATESAADTIVLSHVGAFTTCGDVEGEFYQICEIGRRGEILRTFGDPNYKSHLGLHLPRYIAMDSAGGRMFVADSAKRRILLLNSDFELECVIVEGLDSDPCRLCYDEESGRLLVSDFYGCVCVYSIS